MCVCVCERERERERESVNCEQDSKFLGIWLWSIRSVRPSPYNTVGPITAGLCEAGGRGRTRGPRREAPVQKIFPLSGKHSRQQMIRRDFVFLALLLLFLRSCGTTKGTIEVGTISHSLLRKWPNFYDTLLYSKIMRIVVSTFYWALATQRRCWGQCDQILRNWTTSAKLQKSLAIFWGFIYPSICQFLKV